MRGDIMLFAFVTILVTKTVKNCKIQRNKENLTMIRADLNVISFV